MDRLVAYIKKYLAKLIHAAHTKRGHDALIFGVFLVISAVLWMVLSLNEEDQVDLRMRLRITHVPDSVTVVSTPPDYITVGLRARRTDLLKSTLGREPSLDVDWRTFRSRGAINLGASELKNLARGVVGGATVLSAQPDSLHLLYTSAPGRKLPVVLDYKVTPGPQSALVGRPTFSPDSATLFAIGNAGGGLTAISTEPIRISGLDETTTLRVRLVTPARTRPVPDSIDVTFRVEPLIVKTRRVVIEPVNVPSGIKLITFPAQVDVTYLLPASVYKSSTPQFRVVADYRGINRASGSTRMRLKLVDVSEELQNVYLSADSVEYIIEHK